MVPRDFVGQLPQAKSGVIDLTLLTHIPKSSNIAIGSIFPSNDHPIQSIVIVGDLGA